MSYYLRFIWIPIFGGLFAAQSWMGTTWQGFTHPKAGIVIFCLGCIGLIVARPWLEVTEDDNGPVPYSKWEAQHYDGYWPGQGYCHCKDCR